MIVIEQDVKSDEKSTEKESKTKSTEAKKSITKRADKEEGPIIVTCPKLQKRNYTKR